MVVMPIIFKEDVNMELGIAIAVLVLAWAALDGLAKHKRN